MPPKTSRKSKNFKKRELVLLDTGPIVGLYNENDEWHDRCEDFFGQENRYDYLVTHAVICEVVFHIQKDRHAEAASEAVISFLSMLEKNELQVHEFDQHYITRIKKLRSKYMDKRLDIADLSLVLAAEDRYIQKIVTIDRKDFGFLQFTSTFGKKSKQSGFTIILPES